MWALSSGVDACGHSRHRGRHGGMSRISPELVVGLVGAPFGTMLQAKANSFCGFSLWVDTPSRRPREENRAKPRVRVRKRGEGNRVSRWPEYRLPPLLIYRWRYANRVVNPPAPGRPLRLGSPAWRHHHRAQLRLHHHPRASSESSSLSVPAMAGEFFRPESSYHASRFLPHSTGLSRGCSKQSSF